MSKDTQIFHGTADEIVSITLKALKNKGWVIVDGDELEKLRKMAHSCRDHALTALEQDLDELERHEVMEKEKPQIIRAEYFHECDPAQFPVRFDNGGIPGVGTLAACTHDGCGAVWHVVSIDKKKIQGKLWPSPVWEQKPDVEAEENEPELKRARDSITFWLVMIVLYFGTSISAAITFG